MSEKSRWIWNKTQSSRHYSPNYAASQNNAACPASPTSYIHVPRTHSNHPRDLNARFPTDHRAVATQSGSIHSGIDWSPKSILLPQEDWSSRCQCLQPVVKDVLLRSNGSQQVSVENLWASAEANQSYNCRPSANLNAQSGASYMQIEPMLLNTPCLTPTSPSSGLSSSTCSGNFTRLQVSDLDNHSEENIQDKFLSLSRSQSNDYFGDRGVQHAQTKYDHDTFLNIINDQAECRALQENLAKNPDIYLDHILTTAIPILHQVMEGRFGNYLVQKIVQLCSEQQLYMMLFSIKESLFLIASNVYGTRALQCMLKAITSYRQIRLFEDGLQSNIIVLASHKVGNHILHTYLDHRDRNRADVVTEVIRRNVVRISTNRYGCCVLQHSLKSASPLDQCLLVESCLANLTRLLDDPFGNYVCQSILDLRINDYTKQIYSCMRGSFAQLSTGKFSSNVAEKLLEASNPECLDLILSELESPSVLSHLLQDQYGNYVVQTALSVAVKKKNMVASQFVSRVRLLIENKNSPVFQKIKLKISTV